MDYSYFGVALVCVAIGYYSKSIKKIYQYRHLYTKESMKNYLLLHVRGLMSHHLDSGSLSKENGYASVVYYDGNKKCTILFPCNRHPIIYETVETLSGENITPKIIQYLGAGKNFHGIPTTPIMLGYPEGIRIKFVNRRQYFIPPDVQIPYNMVTFEAQKDKFILENIFQDS